MHDLRLTPALRRALKKPFGKIGFPRKRPAFLVAVGDAASRSLGRLKPDLRVFDCKVERKGVKPLTAKPTFRCVNPAGTITRQAWRCLEKAFKKKRSTVFVKGEEDLLTLPAVLLAPLGAVVAYGQPHKGLVLVKVTRQKKKQAARLLARFAKN